MNPLQCRTAFTMILILSCFSFCQTSLSQTTALPTYEASLNDDQAASLAKLAISGLQREFPNKPSNVITGSETILGPQQMHPAFYGCYDWHSSVHGHWMLVRLLKSNPSHPLAKDSRASLSLNLTKQNLMVEAAYFEEKENKSFERMYGWAWLLRLSAELHDWDDAQGKEWREAIRPLEATIVELAKLYLPRLQFPVRTGVHPDTAFALGQALDYARAVSDLDLESLIVERAKKYYSNDSSYNSAYEPSGEDFFSPSLNEADLMRRILSPNEFADWLTKFLPELSSDSKCNLLQPVEVSDVTDGKLVHLAGLNLSRTWCMTGIANGLPKQDVRISVLTKSAAQHLAAGLHYVFSGHYEGEHWLGTFAVYAK